MLYFIFKIGLMLRTVASRSYGYTIFKMVLKIMVTQRVLVYAAAHENTVLGLSSMFLERGHVEVVYVY